MSIFIGRDKEIQSLSEVYQKNQAAFVIIQGRRRIGKSRLVAEFSKPYRHIKLEGLAPNEKTTAQQQRDEFARQLSEQLNIPPFSMSDWGSLFTFLAKETQKGRVVILLDEISWMGSEDNTFLGKLKLTWDNHFKNNPHLMLIVCGSVSSWIEKNIINSTAFLGRPELYLQLDQLKLIYCNVFWGNQASNITAYEKLKLLSVTGGVPRYLEMINPKISAEDNLYQLCFKDTSPLLNEYQRIFSDIFGRRSDIYKSIIIKLLEGPATQEEILITLKKEKSGDYSEYFSDLELAGFISRDYTWNLSNGLVGKLSKYRIKDNYIRFYLKYIEPNHYKISKGLFNREAMTSLLPWNTLLALQFETLVLNNLTILIKKLNIPMSEIVMAGPYFQKATKERPGCQIDLLIQTTFNTLFVCEIKFSKSKIGSEVIPEINEKIDRLKIKKNYSFRPVLISVNGVTDSVKNSSYFSNLIDFSDFLIE